MQVCENISNLASYVVDADHMMSYQQLDHFGFNIHATVLEHYLS